MTRQRFSHDDPREWLNRANSNLVRAKANIAGSYLEDLCFDAQQAAEKAIKAVFLARSIRFPYIHDLAKLLSLLEQSGESVSGPAKEAKHLSQYAVATRYPWVGEPVTEDEWRKAEIGRAHV